MAGLVTSFGSGAMTNNVNDIRESSCIFSIGSNTTDAHPVFAVNVKAAVINGAKLIVANPKKIRLAEHADIFIQQKPGTDVALLMGMMKVILDENLQDDVFIKERTENFDKLEKSLKNFDLKKVEEITGVPGEKIAAAARIYAENSPAAIIYAMGITQHTHGTDNVMAIANLSMLTGNIGKPGAGVNPLRGQNNVQGACDMGGLPNVYPGYQRVDNPEAQKKFEDAWGVTLDNKVGLTHTVIFDEAYKGNIKGLYVVGENPILSEANAHHAREAIKKMDFMVVQDIFLTETARLADVVLPGAAFAEKDGTVTNTERRVQKMNKAVDPPGEAKQDWWITSEIARRVGGKGFDFNSPEEIFEEIRSLTPSYAGISYERIKDQGLQWPCPSKDHPGTPILHTEKFPRGRGNFVPLEYRESAEVPDREYPYILTTDRSLFHFHTSTMTRQVRGLEEMDSEEILKINPEDAKKLGISDEEIVKISSRRGKLDVKVKTTDICPQGVVSMTFHFHEIPTNDITNPALDPVAKIPETKVAAVRIDKL